MTPPLHFTPCHAAAAVPHLLTILLLLSAAVQGKEPHEASLYVLHLQGILSYFFCDVTMCMYKRKYT